MHVTLDVDEKVERIVMSSAGDFLSGWEALDKERAHASDVVCGEGGAGSVDEVFSLDASNGGVGSGVRGGLVFTAQLGRMLAVGAVAGVPGDVIGPAVVLLCLAADGEGNLDACDGCDGEKLGLDCELAQNDVEEHVACACNGWREVEGDANAALQRTGLVAVDKCEFVLVEEVARDNRCMVVTLLLLLLLLLKCWRQRRWEWAGGGLSAASCSRGRSRRGVRRRGL